MPFVVGNDGRFGKGADYYFDGVGDENQEERDGRVGGKVKKEMLRGDNSEPHR